MRSVRFTNVGQTVQVLLTRPGGRCSQENRCSVSSPGILGFRGGVRASRSIGEATLNNIIACRRPRNLPVNFQVCRSRPWADLPQPGFDFLTERIALREIACDVWRNRRLLPDVRPPAPPHHRSRHQQPHCSCTRPPPPFGPHLDAQT